MIHWLIPTLAILGAAAAYAQIGPNGTSNPMNSTAPIGVGSTSSIGPGRPLGAVANLPQPVACGNGTIDLSTGCAFAMLGVM